MKKVVLLMVGALVLADLSFGTSDLAGFKFGPHLLSPMDYSSAKSIERESFLATLIRSTIEGKEKDKMIGLDSIYEGELVHLVYLHDQKPSTGRRKGIDDHMVQFSVVSKDSTRGIHDHRRMQTTYKAHVWVEKHDEKFAYKAELISVVEMAWDR